MYILAIETSCDDTCVAVLKNDCVLSSVISTQTSFHKKFGGVVPRIAKQKHIELIDPCIEKALKKAKINIEKIDIFAVTYGPGLAIALEVGIKKAKELAKKYNKPLVAVNHLEGHLLSPMLKDSTGKLYFKTKVGFPFISMVVSGGHTEIVLVKEIGKYKLLGQTLDDAAGEAFDKVARLLKLGYPGGPLISKVAETGDRKKYVLPKPLIKSDDLNFSFSGLKTSCLVNLRKIYLNKKQKEDKNFVIKKGDLNYYDSKDMFFSKQEISDFAASFEKAVVDILVTKLVNAASKNKVEYVSIGGGVSANNYLRKRIRKEFLGKNIVLMPDKRFCTDNAAMIGIVAYFKAQKKQFVKDVDLLDRVPTLNF